MPRISATTLCAAVVLLSAVTAAPAVAQENPAAEVKDYTVFVDPPTAFAFIKLPTGWKFIGKLDVDQLRHLPPGTVTSLRREDDAVVLADAPASPVRAHRAVR